MSVLDTILEEKKSEVEVLYSVFNISHARSQIDDLPPCRDLVGALNSSTDVPIIAEIKRRSPSRGDLAMGIDVGEWGQIYQNNGAAAISVLTDLKNFGGSISDLGACQNAVRIPVLRKDFIVDEAQLYQSRLAGADAVLLIAAALSDQQYRNLLKITLELGMVPLSEVHNREELDRILPFSPPLIGINNRNLHTLETDINVTKQLMSAVPKETAVISESGIQSSAQIRELLDCGVCGFLIGTSLMTAENPAQLLRELSKK